MPTPPDDSKQPDGSDADRAIDAFLASGEHRGAWNVDDMWSRVRAEAVDAKPLTRLQLQPTPARVSRILHGGRGWIVPTVAGGLLAAAAALFLFANSGEVTRFIPPPTAVHDYVTQRGERATIELPDGSRVTIGPESHLRVPDGFGTNGVPRAVTLSGEAIFVVRHDSTSPFRVRIAHADLVDLGTRFDVDAYDSLATRVAVAEGAVAFSPDGPRPVTLKQGDVGRLERTRVAVSRPRAIESYFAWATGTLSVDNVALRDVLKTIARWYDFDIRVADNSLLDRRVTAAFATHEPDAMLRGLATALGARIERKGQSVTLTSVVP